MRQIASMGQIFLTLMFHMLENLRGYISYFVCFLYVRKIVCTLANITIRKKCFHFYKHILITKNKNVHEKEYIGLKKLMLDLLKNCLQRLLRSTDFNYSYTAKWPAYMIFQKILSNMLPIQKAV